MLIVLHICLYRMPYRSDKMSLGGSETIISYKQSRKIYCDLALGKFDF